MVYPQIRAWNLGLWRLALDIGTSKTKGQSTKGQSTQAHLLVDPAGLKPAPHGLKGRCSVTRAPDRKELAVAEGLEPSMPD